LQMEAIARRVGGAAYLQSQNSHNVRHTHSLNEIHHLNCLSLVYYYH